MSIVVSAPTEPRSRVSHITDVEKTSLQGRHTKPKLTKGDVRPTHSQREGRVHVSSGASISHSPLCAVCVVFVPIMQFFSSFRRFCSVHRQIEISFHYLIIMVYLWFVLTPSFPRNCIDAFDDDPYLFWKSSFLGEESWSMSNRKFHKLSFANNNNNKALEAYARSAQKSTKKGQALRFGKWLIIASEMRP